MGVGSGILEVGDYYFLCCMEIGTDAFKSWTNRFKTVTYTEDGHKQTTKTSTTI